MCVCAFGCLLPVKLGSSVDFDSIMKTASLQKAFSNTFASEVASALGIDVSRVTVTSINAVNDTVGFRCAACGVIGVM